MQTCFRRPCIEHNQHHLSRDSAESALAEVYAFMGVNFVFHICGRLNESDWWSSLSSPFPPHSWEHHRDQRGCTYYVDHNTRTTIWQQPTAELVQYYHQGQQGELSNLQQRTQQCSLERIDETTLGMYTNVYTFCACLHVCPLAVFAPLKSALYFGCVCPLDTPQGQFTLLVHPKVNLPLGTPQGQRN